MAELGPSSTPCLKPIAPSYGGALSARMVRNVQYRVFLDVALGVVLFLVLGELVCESLWYQFRLLRHRRGVLYSLAGRGSTA